MLRLGSTSVHRFVLSGVEQIVLLGLLSKLLSGDTLSKDNLSPMELEILSDMSEDFLDEFKIINR